MEIYMIKRICMLFAAVIMLVPMLAFDSEAICMRAPRIEIDGNGYYNTAFVKDEITYVSVRAFCVAMDSSAVVSYDAASGRARVKTAALDMTLEPESVYVIANGRCLFSSGKVYATGGVMYAPLRLIAGAFGAEVYWNQDSYSVSVVRGSGGVVSGDKYYDQNDLYWLSRIIEAESCSEPFSGKLAVGSVVMNRVKSSAYPNTVYGVIFDKRYGVQFSPILSGTIYNTPCEECVCAAKLVLEGYSVSEDILYFLNPVYANNFWITQNCRYVMSLGNHRFYA